MVGHKEWGWGGGTAVRALVLAQVGVWLPHGGSQPSVTLVPQDLTPRLASLAWYTDAHADRNTTRETLPVLHSEVNEVETNTEASLKGKSSDVGMKKDPPRSGLELKTPG